jgi:preprotein translocase subunit SecD
VKPEGNLSSEDLDSLVAITQERLNVFGISDVVVRSARDSPFPDANTFMVVEVAGATPSELEQIIGQQGKFEAKIGNDTVFVGGKEDITSVCRNDATCSGIRSCSPSSQGHACTFDFVIYLSPAAAERQAEITATLDENATANGRVLSKPLDLYLDDNLVDSLQISSNLKGKAATQISITGPGFGATQEEAIKAAQENMVQLQTVLVTGSLPVKLIIVKLDSISPLLGKEFIRSILYAGLASIIAVALVLFLRYRDFKLVAPIMFTLISEVTIVLGTAALIKWNLDLASIAGIIAAIGTGVDDQIVIIDESRKSKTHSYSMKERMKRAFFIIFGAFAATFVAMLPLWWAGAGLLRGFAVTTILGIIIGVFITRPAFADFISQTAEE